MFFIFDKKLNFFFAISKLLIFMASNSFCVLLRAVVISDTSLQKCIFHFRRRILLVRFAIKENTVSFMRSCKHGSTNTNVSLYKNRIVKFCVCKSSLSALRARKFITTRMLLKLQMSGLALTVCCCCLFSCKLPHYLP